MSAEIVTSTGELGLSARSYGRLYATADRYIQSPTVVNGVWGRIRGVQKRRPNRYSRCVLRAAVSTAVLEHLVNDERSQDIEAALSLNRFTQANDWLVTLGSTSPDRASLVPVDEMVLNTDYGSPPAKPRASIQAVINRGFRFYDTIPLDMSGGAFQLWQDTFGWEEDQVQNLRARLQAEIAGPPDARSLWFSGVRDNGKLVSIAMAERLDVPSAYGHVSLIESTEWRTRDDYQQQGLMAAVLSLLNAQIVNSMSHTGQPFVIFAECNYASRSDRAGVKAGFRIPDREIGSVVVPQILVQNVEVGDGFDLPSKLRDFVFMYVPADIVGEHYNPSQVEQMLREL